MNPRTIARLMLGGALAAEGALALRRFEARRRAYQAAVRRASEAGRPLIVVGDPDAGTHTRLVRAYGCGDRCIDLRGCPHCEVMQAADLTRGPIEGIADDSAVVYVSCVLEYVSDPEAALRELNRMAGSPHGRALPGRPLGRRRRRAPGHDEAHHDPAQARHARRPRGPADARPVAAALSMRRNDNRNRDVTW